MDIVAIAIECIHRILILHASSLWTCARVCVHVYIFACLSCWLY